jgi:hypothetical protein
MRRRPRSATSRRQRLQRGTLKLDCPAAAGIGATDDLVDEAAIAIEVIEVAAAAQQQRLLDRHLEVPVAGLDRAVLVRDPGLFRVGTMA